jgi:hypothetical protein
MSALIRVVLRSARIAIERSPQSVHPELFALLGSVRSGDPIE